MKKIYIRICLVDQDTLLDECLLEQPAGELTEETVANMRGFLQEAQSADGGRE
jgi:hypothetical protein